jgi:hypothetical protein
MRHVSHRSAMAAFTRSSGLLVRTGKAAWPVSLIATALGACASGPGGYATAAPMPPPPPPVVENPSPRPGFVWAPGYWSWQGGSHVWVPGRWMPARKGEHWEADRWAERDGRWYFEPGHWAQGDVGEGVLR